MTASVLQRTPISINAASRKRSVAIVLGCDRVGSAVAHALHRAGLAVVLVDGVDPPWCRRGMAYTNAWYLGSAELEGEAACFCASLKSIPSILSRRLIAATTWSWAGVVAELDAIAIIDARLDGRAPKAALRSRVQHAVGLGNGFLPGFDVDVVIDACGQDDVDTLATPARAGVESQAPAVGGAAVKSLQAEQNGRFVTNHRIADPVRAGEVVGHLHLQPIVAPCDGVLCGLSARGARMLRGQTIVEVDPRGDPALCHGLTEGPLRIARRVVAALAMRGVIAAEGR
ncbi:MAG TPA: hypothetical protein VEN29_03225 [Casimicrobiaceae bacterium]|nr:hypothetical protein [Casimicrobiaceae bacterium]